MTRVRIAVFASALLLAGAVRASDVKSGFMNQEEQRAAAALVHTTPAYVDLTAHAARPTSGAMSQEQQRAAASGVRTTPAEVDLTACPPSHEAAHEAIAQRELQVPDRDRGKVLSSTNCCAPGARMTSARADAGEHR